ncbi:DUF6642 family protein [Flaviaesturariibacter amylovorans]|uniref:CHAT domain-containing protein n=1 Tax=Flaviaesturariibacter amylovorans TaxID=1084520 RepID=A0ABP8HGM3_9BACT
MKGVFCLEGFWYGDHRDKTSVAPLLELLHRYSDMPFIHHRCATLDEFRYSLSRWKTKAFQRRYPILYISFHGEPGMVLIGDTRIDLPELGELLGNKCERTVIHFGCCSTLNYDKRLLQNFMERTRCLAVLGYKEDVEWLPSSAFEILLLDNLSRFPFDSKGMKDFGTEIFDMYGAHARRLDFRFVANEREHFPRRRKQVRAE